MSTRRKIEKSDGPVAGKAGDAGVESLGTADEDDVEGHNIGMLNPTLAREMTLARERDIARQTSRQSVLSEARRALGKKR